MRKRTMWITAAASAAVLLGGASIAVAAGEQARDLQYGGLRALTATIGDLEIDDDFGGPALSEADFAKASRAALDRVGQGTVTEVEREDDAGAFYEVEVRLNNGSQVEVSLGADFQVTSQSAPEFDDD